MSKNEEARKILISSFGNKNLKLPGNVSFVLEKNQTQCRIKLNPKKVQTENMQTDTNAFEGWAVALHIALDKPGKIILDVDGEFKRIPYETNGHWGRFLYRALRFSQQYGEWFELSGKIKAVVTEFEKYLEKEYFTNNPPEYEAGIKESHGDENIVEAKFAEDGKLQEALACFDVGNNKVYRQLPVGLFKIIEDVDKNKSYKYSDKTKVFTGRKSAIDLWTWNEDIFEVIELKTNNPMMGIVTEIFFYSNYMYDFLVGRDRRFILNAPKKEEVNNRGYLTIWHSVRERSYEKIRGIMLADKYHSILENPTVLEILNCNGMNIEYVQAKYKYELELFKYEG